MNVLSLFDGISCGRVALERAGLKVTNYFASEIDKHAITIAKKNYPNTIHLGDVTKVKTTELPKIGLLIGGSPCQGFSFAGKNLNFEDPRSKLFFEFVRLLNEIRAYNPDVKFLLENVVMKKESQQIISGLIGVEPILINSSLVSAQNRKRLYWTNIPCISQPADKGIFLQDILLDSFDICGAVRGRYKIEGKRQDHKIKTAGLTTQLIEVKDDFKSNTLTSVQKDNILIHSQKAIDFMNREVKGGRTHWDFKHHSDTKESKSKAVVANFFKGIPYNVLKDSDCIRKFHPIECERLQTLPDNYTEGIPATQRYKAIGNGWTVDVITHIFKYIK